MRRVRLAREIAVSAEYTRGMIVLRVNDEKPCVFFAERWPIMSHHEQVLFLEDVLALPCEDDHAIAVLHAAWRAINALERCQESPFPHYDRWKDKHGR